MASHSVPFLMSAAEEREKTVEELRRLMKMSDLERWEAWVASLEGVGPSTELAKRALTTASMSATRYPTPSPLLA